MAFAWDLAPRIFLISGALLVLLAGVLLLQAPQSAIYPLAIGATLLLAAAAMAYEGPR